MDDAEVEHRVVAVVVSVERGPQVRGTATDQGDPISAGCQPLTGAIDHRRIQIEGIDPVGAEAL